MAPSGSICAIRPRRCASRRRSRISTMRWPNTTPPASRASWRASARRVPDPRLRWRGRSRRRMRSCKDGMTHAYAAADVWLRLADSLADETQRLACATEALAYIAYDTLRERPYPLHRRERTAWDAEKFAAAVEAQDESAAIALVNGALAQGLHFADLEPALAARGARALQRFRPFADLPHACAAADRALGNRRGSAAVAGMAALADLRDARGPAAGLSRLCRCARRLAGATLGRRARLPGADASKADRSARC